MMRSEPECLLWLETGDFPERCKADLGISLKMILDFILAWETTTDTTILKSNGPVVDQRFLGKARRIESSSSGKEKDEHQHGRDGPFSVSGGVPIRALALQR